MSQGVVGRNGIHEIRRFGHVVVALRERTGKSQVAPAVTRGEKFFADAGLALEQRDFLARKPRSEI